MTAAENTTDAGPAELSAELQERIAAAVGALVAGSDEQRESELAHLAGRVQDLVDRKRRMEGTKTDTRDFLGELLFARLRRGMKEVVGGADEVTALRAAEWVMGTLFSVATLSEFATAFDRALLRATSASDDFNFAGRTDFISVEEVMQMLASGKHLGCLSLEKDDNRVDVYIGDGRIFFVDPHHLRRRVLPRRDKMGHREISHEQLLAAESARADEGVPCILTLAERGVIPAAERLEALRLLGKEALFEFMREAEPYAFYYKQLDALPEFAVEHDLRIGVTALLLECSKLLDDWRQMREVFPDPDAPLVPTQDMFARMGDAALGVLEIKLLSQLNGETTPRSLVASLGLPLPDVYALLIRLAREGIVDPPGDLEALRGLDSLDEDASLDETLQEAFAALDDNDDAGQRQSVIDRVFGDDDAAGEVGALSALDRVLDDGVDDDDRRGPMLDLLRRPTP